MAKASRAKAGSERPSKSYELGPNRVSSRSRGARYQLNIVVRAVIKITTTALIQR
jgi:hypothetical protein